MKPFSSSILKESAATAVLPVNPIKPTNPTFTSVSCDISKDTATLEANSAKEFYKSLITYIKTADPKSFNPGYMAQIAKLEGFIKCITMDSFPYDSEEDEIRRKNDKIISFLLKGSENGKLPNVSVRLANISSKPVYFESQNVIQYIDSYCKSIISAITKSEKMPEMNSDTEVINLISRLACGKSSDSIDDFRSEYSKLFKIDYTEVPISIAASIFRNGYDIGAGTYLSGYDLERTITPLISTLKVSMDKFENPNEFKAIIDSLCNIVFNAQMGIMTMNKVAENYRICLMKHNIEAVKSALIEEHIDRSLFESVSMHGVEMDKETFFNTLETEDFNPTEFMNLAAMIDADSAVTECMIKLQGMAYEAMCIANGDYDSLMNIDEAIAARVQSVASNILEGIKALIAKFNEAMLNGLKLERPWLEKYKNTILNNSWGNRGITFSCYYDERHRALIDNLKMPPIDYTKLNTEGGAGAFENEETFFKTYFKDLDNAIKTLDTAKVITPEMSIADKCKYIMGAKFPEGKTNTQVPYSSLKIADMYNWLLLNDKLTNNIKQQQSVLERSNRAYETAIKNLKANQPAAQNNTQAKPAAAPAQNAASAQHESYYSYIFEVELEKQDNPTMTQTNTVNNNPTDLKNTSAQAKSQIEKSGDTGATAEGKMKIYMKVCKDVLAAELTAVRYLRSEYISLMRSIVTAKLGKGADLKKPAENANTNTQQQQQPAAQAQQPAQQPTA